MIYKKLHRSSSTNLTKYRDWTHVLRKSFQLLHYQWHPSCCSCYKPDEKENQITKKSFGANKPNGLYKINKIGQVYCVVLLFLFSSSCVPYVASFPGLFIMIAPLVFFNVYLSCVPQVASFSGLSIMIAPLVFSNVYLSCVLYVASFSGLSIMITPLIFSNVYLPMTERD